ncbi:MAG: CRISPR-associated protein Cas4 [Candidatus Cloacimonadaceae bacterium]
MQFDFVTPSDVVEYMYCPRFVYFMNVLGIEQHEHKRTLVNKGRDIHEKKLVENKDYLRKRLNAIDKYLDVYLSSEKLHLVGKVDEVLVLGNGNAMPLDYKYAYWENKLYKTHKMQQILYALLIEENFERPVNQAAIVYIRSKNHLEIFEITDAMKKKALDVVNKIFKITRDGIFPNTKAVKRKCEDCCYRNICIS